MRSPILPVVATVAFVVATLAPTVDAILPHYERAAGPVAYERFGAEACAAEMAAALSTREAVLALAGACGARVLALDGCENGDTSFHSCSLAGPDGSFTWIEFEDASDPPLTGALTLWTWDANGRVVERASGVLATVGGAV